MNKLDLSEVKFSRRDKNFGIKIPSKLSADLAYEIGFHIGDGHLTITKRKDTGVSMFHIVFSGNWKEEKDFYKNTIVPLIFKIYNKKPHMRMEHKNTIRLYFNSKAVALFKSKVLGLPTGNKKGRVSIPKLILNSSPRMKASCLGGIIDSDFCLSFKKDGRYPNLSASFPLECKKLVNNIKSILKGIGITCSICIENRNDVRRNPMFYKAYRIDINGKENLRKKVRYISFRNPIHFTKLLLWEKTGRCLPNTTLKHRIKSIASVAQFGRAFAWTI